MSNFQFLMIQISTLTNLTYNCGNSKIEWKNFGKKISGRVFSLSFRIENPSEILKQIL